MILGVDWVNLCTFSFEAVPIEGYYLYFLLLTELDYIFQMIFKKMAAITDLSAMAYEKGHVVFSNKTQRSPFYAPRLFFPASWRQAMALSGDDKARRWRSPCL